MTICLKVAALGMEDAANAVKLLNERMQLSGASRAGMAKCIACVGGFGLDRRWLCCMGAPFEGSTDRAPTATHASRLPA